MADMQIIINGAVFDTNIGVSGVIASDSAVIHPDSLAQVMTYDAMARITSVTVNDGANAYKQTYTYVDAKSKNIATISQWVKQ